MVAGKGFEPLTFGL